VTRDLEAVPTVVAVVKPVWPERASMYEQRHREEMEDYKRLRNEIHGMKDRVTILSQSNTVLESQYELKTAEIRALKKNVEELKAIAHADGSDLGRLKRQQATALDALQAQKEEADRAYYQAQDLFAEAEDHRRQALDERRINEEIARDEELIYSKRRADLEEKFSKMSRALQQQDIDNGEVAAELDKKMAKADCGDQHDL
jgi:hypothetical protein